MNLCQLIDQLCQQVNSLYHITFATSPSQQSAYITQLSSHECCSEGNILHVNNP